MTLSFRNLTIDPRTPVRAWPVEAVQTALERGDIRDWRRLAEEIRSDPWGPTARLVEEVLGFSRPYGVGELMEAVISIERDRAESREKQAVATEVRAAISRSGLSAADFAERIGTSASRLSTYATGKVVPAASLMIRIRRVADRQAARDVSRRRG